MLAIITVVGDKHKLPANLVWSEMCQTNKEMGYHMANLAGNGQWPTAIFIPDHAIDTIKSPVNRKKTKLKSSATTLYCITQIKYPSHNSI